MFSKTLVGVSGRALDKVLLNVRKFGTMFVTVAGATKLEGSIRRRK